MSNFPLFIHGHGAISSAGIGSKALYQACLEKRDIPTASIERFSGEKMLKYPFRPVDTEALKAAMPKHPRLRRASNVTKYAVTAAHEAIGALRMEKMKNRELNIGIVLTFLNGCVNYSNRFFSEVIDNPTFASPILFPETVFNAPASHIASYIDCDGPVYTLIGDSATWFSALTVADDWIANGLVDGCLILCAEEADWLSLEGLNLYSRELIATEGAAAIYVERNPSEVSIAQLNGPFTYTDSLGRAEAIKRAFSAIPTDSALLIDGLSSVKRMDKVEAHAISAFSGPRFSPAAILGEGMGIRCGFQTIAAIEHLRAGEESVSILASGTNQQAFSTTLTRNPS